ncbi:GNAT family N-acetyltransferase [Brasilonema sp. UFV-L1]|uniref:GNAT family N-acetyltransferase n=1 Tax=Brasilonema sp. UFV-L1 TaxID=2234130 RepID=UPI00145C5CE1|nr:GNAT family N-acetyltransferase [Brasilonema sp. UFV-L1]NMG05556.1 N-acetyltransferase [Brasilonema sp. UFV-L1]
MTEIFQTQRLIIRQWIPEADAAQAFEIYGDSEVVRFLSCNQQQSVEDVQIKLQRLVENDARLNNGTGIWAIVEKQTREIIGSVLVQQLPDNEDKVTQDYAVGWHLKKAAWGKGYATEVGRGVIEYGFKILKLPVIYAVATPDNHASIRVTQKLGMVPIGRTDKYYSAELELFKLDAKQFRRGGTYANYQHNIT